MPRALLAVLLLAALPARLHAQSEPPTPPAPWFKGNLHTHTLWSDGNELPELVADWYKQQGYHFLALSDHNVLQVGEKWIKVDSVIARGGRRSLGNSKARFGEGFVETRTNADGKTEVRLKRLDEIRAVLDEPGRFLMLASEEISDKLDTLPVHINATNLGEQIAPQGGTSVRDVMRNNLRAVQEQAVRLARPVLAHLNHPNFYWAITAEDLAHVVEERFFEVFNGHPSVHQEGDAEHASIEKLWDIANTLRIAELKAPPLYGVATDDSHTYHAVNVADPIPGRGYVMVQAAELSAEILTSVSLTSDTIALRIEAKPGTTYVTRFLGTRRGYDRSVQPVVDGAGQVVRATQRYSPEIGVSFAEATGPEPHFRLRGDELYVRAVVTASTPHARPTWAGQREQAWTQPVGWQTK
jgi:hypothetical protein